MSGKGDIRRRLKEYWRLVKLSAPDNRQTNAGELYLQENPDIRKFVNTDEKFKARLSDLISKMDRLVGRKVSRKAARIMVFSRDYENIGLERAVSDYHTFARGGLSEVSSAVLSSVNLWPDNSDSAGERAIQIYHCQTPPFDYKIDPLSEIEYRKMLSNIDEEDMPEAGRAFQVFWDIEIEDSV